MIYNAVLNGNNVRILNIDSGFESATFTDEDKVNELVFDYTRYYDLMFNAKIDINNVLLIGGSGYSYPKYYISHYKNIKKSLNKNGVYLTNIISSLECKNSRFLKAEVKTLKQVFKNVYIVPCNYTNDTEQVQNNMIIATDSDIIYENTYNYNLAEDEIILTDDYCPIDTLIPSEN